MSIRIITPPAAEPVTLPEMKLVLRVDHDDEDELIRALIRVGRERVEAATGRALIQRDVVQVMDDWPSGGGEIRLGVGPARHVEVCVIGETGEAATVDPGVYQADLEGVPPRLALARGARWPRPGRAVGGIEIAFTAGYGGSPDDVPEGLRQAVREIAADAYEHGAQRALAPATETLLAPYRRVRL